MSINSRKFIVEFNNNLEKSKNPFIEESDHFKMVKCRGGYEKGPLPTIEGFTDYSTSYNLNFYWIDRAKSLNIVKKHIYDIIHNWLKYPEEKTKKAIEVAEIQKIKLPEEHLKQFRQLNPNFNPPDKWEVIIKMDI